MTTLNVKTLSNAIQDFRRRLVETGFVHTSRVGELLYATGGPYDLCIRTGYSTSTYRVLVFTRNAGHGQRQGQGYIDFNADRWNPELLERLYDALTRWDGKTWPLVPEISFSPVGNPGWRP